MTLLRKKFISLALLVSLSVAFEFRPGLANAATETPKPATAKEILSLVKESKTQFTLVNVWATWCEPCKAEMPELVKFASEHEKEVRLILVSADSQDEIKGVTEFLNSAKATSPSYILSEPPDDFAKVFAPSWSATLPTTFVFDSKGQQKTFWTGKVTRNDLEGKLKAHFKAPLAKAKKI